MQQKMTCNKKSAEKGNTERKESNTMLKFYQQRLHIRPGKHYPLGRFGRLFHQYAIDMWIKIENSRLQYIRMNNKNMRCTNSAETRADDEPVGQDEGKSYVYLPRSFTGGPRYYRAKFLDAINAVNELGAGMLLITMTTNPDWPEIRENLAPGETARDRPDIVARVFYQKWRQLKDDITKHHVLGFCVAQEDVHEFQKNGLPHGHIIVILQQSDRPRTPEDIDRIVSAELPDKTTNPKDFKLVTKHMLHECKKGRCLNDDGVCCKKFPRDFRETTVWHGDQRIQYRRRADGRTFITKKNAVLDNRHVVPYNLYLLRKYQCHLNIEVCSTKIAAVRYLFGYINKGVDMATLKASVTNHKDEIEYFVNGRYITAPEACHKLFGFEILNVSPPTVRLPVHLEGQKWRRLGRVGDQRQPADKPSELEAFFLLNQERLADGDTEDLYYTNVSKYYTWKSDEHVWAKRINCEKSKIGYSLNRMDNVLMKVREQYFLRLLLLEVPSPTCYQDLRTVNGAVHATYEDACRARGMLTDDKTWNLTMDEAELMYSPQQVRSVFAQILAYGEISNPLELYLNHIRQMSEDFRKEHDSEEATEDDRRKVLDDIERHLVGMQTSLRDFASLAVLLPNEDSQERKTPHVIQERMYTGEEVEEYFANYSRKHQQANKEQRFALDKVVAAINRISEGHDESDRLFLINAAAGTGKTFVDSAIIDYVRYLFKTNVASIQVSTTAMSAQLLEDAFTAHSTFKLPLQIDDDGTVRCAIEFDTKTARIMAKAKLLIWDEALSARKGLIQAVDKFFRELLGIDKPFGGLVIVLTGDNRQTLPKISHGRRGDIINACLQNSYLMQHFNVVNLTDNMRIKRAEHPQLEGTTTLRDFEDFLLRMGDGTLDTDEEGRFLVPDYIHKSSSVEEMIEFVYGKDINKVKPMDLSERAILCPLNEDVREVNRIVLEKLDGTVKTYLSSDTEIGPDGQPVTELPTDVLHSLNRSGMPMHQLDIKEHCVVMCLRNMSMGICNGTKLYVVNAHEHTLECIVLTGRAKGNTVVLPRITLTDDSGNDTVRFKRKQFPVALAYACSIDKSQGQSLKSCGLLCRTECFSHGQCYTAYSRPMGPEFMTVHQPESHCSKRNHVRMRNVVWPEAFPDGTHVRKKRKISHGESLVGKRVAKEFGANGIFLGQICQFLPVGTVENVKEDLWSILYDDGDEEDLNVDEVTEVLALYEKERKNGSY